MVLRSIQFLSILILWVFCFSLHAQTSADTSLISPSGRGQNIPLAGPVSQLNGVEFIEGSSSQIILEKDGKRYLIDAATRQIHEIPMHSQRATQAALDQSSQSQSQAEVKQPGTTTTPKIEATKDKDIYYTEDIVLWTLPTVHHIEKKSLYLDFTHRFAYDTAFKGPARLSYLFGLDGFSVSSFGLTYGLTDRFFVGAYRVPSVLGREIQLSGGGQLSQESLGHPFSSIVRVSVEGTNHFRDEYITSVEFAMARSIKKRAQLYVVPSVSFNNRSLEDVIDLLTSGKGETTSAIGAGVSIDFRPTVAF